MSGGLLRYCSSVDNPRLLAESSQLLNVIACMNSKVRDTREIGERNVQGNY